MEVVENEVKINSGASICSKQRNSFICEKTPSSVLFFCVFFFGVNCLSKCLSAFQRAAVPQALGRRFLALMSTYFSEY